MQPEQERTSSEINSSNSFSSNLRNLGGKALLVSTGLVGGWLGHAKLVKDEVDSVERNLNGRIESLKNEQNQALDLAQHSFQEEQAALSEKLDAEIERLKTAMHEVLDIRVSDLDNGLRDANALIDLRYKELEDKLNLDDSTIEGRLAKSETHLDILDSRFSSEQRRLDIQIEALTKIVGDVKQDEKRDLVKMWRELVGPVVQLAGENSVGSGVLLKSEYSTVSNEYVTPILTAWHVVRDIQGDPPDVKLPVPTSVYSEDGSVSHQSAKLICHDVSLDLALLELRTSTPFPNGAKLPTPERLKEIKIFDEIYAVGCPLGNDPIPTRGEVATLQHEVDGQRYWMLNAQTYIGNSGGAIFSADEHELLGIFSKIYTHGSLRPTIVPHMGLATPMDKVYGWLENNNYLSYVSHPGNYDSQLALANKANHKTAVKAGR